MEIEPARTLVAVDFEWGLVVTLGGAPDLAHRDRSHTALHRLRTVGRWWFRGQLHL